MKNLTLITLLLMLHSLVLFGQGKVVDNPGDGPKWISKKSFGTMLHERFKDSIPGLDSMRFEIVVDKNGHAQKVVLMEDYFAPKVLPANLAKLSAFIKCFMQWEPAWVPTKKGKKRFDCAVFEWVNFEFINSKISASN